MGQGRPHSCAPAVRVKARDVAISQVRIGCYAGPAICCRTWEGSMRSRVRTGSVVQDKRDKVWYFYWWENGKRRSKVLGRFSTKVTAWRAAKPLRDALETQTKNNSGVPTVNTLVEQYRAEKMP